MKNAKNLVVPGIAAGLLLIPLIAMQFTSEVQWSLSDFLIAGTLLLGAGAAIQLTLRKITSLRNRIVVCGIIITALFLVWAELAVGIFGTPFAGT
ncbi:MAG: hypothetical protein WCD31_13280 [Gillisia sp.]